MLKEKDFVAVVGVLIALWTEQATPFLPQTFMYSHAFPYVSKNS